MDIWAVGAAAAAGYIAKYWQNYSRERSNSSELSPEASEKEKPKLPSCPIRRLTQRKKLSEDTSTEERKSSDGRLPAAHQSDSASEAEVVSTSGYGEQLGNFRGYEDCNVLSMSCLEPGFSKIENLDEDGNENGLNSDGCDYHRKPCTSSVDFFDSSGRKRRSLRTKHSCGTFVKPLNSLESCLMAQLYNARGRTEDYVFSALPSPSTTARPLLVTDGRQIISRAHGDTFCAWNSDGRLHKEENLHLVSPLSKLGTLYLPEKVGSNSRKGQDKGLSNFLKTGNEKFFYSENGLRDKMILFCLGLSMGIISSLIANRTELSKLKEMLKQTENLVQDLQEELEMKDSLTVKELSNENCNLQNTCQSPLNNMAPNPLLHGQNVDSSVHNDGIESYTEKGEENTESMSKIEAELEAELQMLGLDMNSSGMERRLNDLLELDPDFEADFAQGELRPDMADLHALAQSESDQDASRTPTTHSANYAVSPRELSLRLHEVIQSRLEERVKELETALQDSQRKVQLMEFEHLNTQRKLSSNELRYSTADQQSPTSEKDYNIMNQPLVMNLAGEALDAYNEAYVELMKMNESDDEDSPVGVPDDNWDGPFNPFVQRCVDDEANDSLAYYSRSEERMPKRLYNTRLNTFRERNTRIQEILYTGLSEDETSECDDEMEKLLIKQIVEKTKKGSPVVVNAQRMLFSLDKIGH
ncbi:hypothetical protein Tsubulata_046177 [Turnera subulata]|uniref:Uncharacterized protein n=1 Tax=Turnera subulata TaxID=218843 RepID=A0A9Q0F4Z4_9ROSI|nr:hypothetical protein Tsubulata_046177 [Turnera subulata]